MSPFKKYLKYLLIFVAGIILSYFIFKSTAKDSRSEASHTIAYSIQRLNKMVVAEQNYSTVRTSTIKNRFMGIDALSAESRLLMKVDTRAQASYDLSKMQVEIDSVNEVIHIKYVPELQIETFPDVEFLEVNQSIFNQLTTEDLNGIKQRALQDVQNTIDQTDLRRQAHDQLIQNLEEIYLLARIYGWEVRDDTKYSRELEQRIRL